MYMTYSSPISLQIRQYLLSELCMLAIDLQSTGQNKSTCLYATIYTLTNT